MFVAITLLPSQLTVEDQINTHVLPLLVMAHPIGPACAVALTFHQGSDCDTG